MSLPPDEAQRSREACPICGAHQLAVEQPPDIAVLGVQPNSDLLGMGDLKLRSAPAIVCRSCGTLWRDLEAFRNGEPEPPDAASGSDEPDEGDEDEPDDEASHEDGDQQGVETKRDDAADA